MNVFDCAIKMEEEARGYYLQLAEAAGAEELKDLFTLLAQAEQEHHDALVKMKDAMGLRQPELNGPHEAARLLQPVLARRELMAELEKTPDAYGMVIGQEQKGIDFYEELAAKAKDRRVREILLGIADEARRHLGMVRRATASWSPRKKYGWDAPGPGGWN